MIQDIQIFGARLHNLKNVHVTIPTGKISAICGPSGCGKSTLALDVLHAECQRRYLETLSPFIARIAGVRGAVPVDSISGLRPSIAFESWDTRRDGRASVGGLTECDHLLRGIWIRKATFTCPICAKVLDISTSQEMVERIALLPPGSRAQLMSPIIATSQTLEALAQTWIAQGFVRAYCDGNFLELSSIPASMAQSIPRQFSVVVDRWIIKEGIRSRIADSLAIALRIGQGSLWVHQQDGPQLYLSLSPRCPEHGAFMPELDAGMFSPYSLVGRCPQCEGNGKSESSEVCTQCHGSRLNEILRTTQCGGLSWQALVAFPIEDLHPRLQPIFADLPPVYQPAWRQVQERFVAMKKLGLGHLGLARGLDTLSDGELQRLRLVNLAGGHLNGLLFILDEPGSGLHPED
jgi:excinuclease ABC subunit A